MLLTHPWKHISIAETAESTSICLLTHSNPAVDLAGEFAKRRILVISGSDFYTISKNSARFFSTSDYYMQKVLAELDEIDALD